MYGNGSRILDVKRVRASSELLDHNQNRFKEGIQRPINNGSRKKYFIIEGLPPFQISSARTSMLPALPCASAPLHDLTD